MSRYLGLRFELSHGGGGFYRPTGAGPLHWDDIEDFEVGFDPRGKADLRHVVDEPLNSRIHYATSAVWRMDTNRASFWISTTSWSSNLLLSGWSLPLISPRS